MNNAIFAVLMSGGLLDDSSYLPYILFGIGCLAFLRAGFLMATTVYHVCVQFWPLLVSFRSLHDRVKNTEAQPETRESMLSFYYKKSLNKNLHGRITRDYISGKQNKNVENIHLGNDIIVLELI